MRLPIHQLDAFADAVFQGNPAAVCPLEEWLPETVMQSIAAENNLAETAFYVPAGDDFDLRWFTPTKEVDLCGHATLAAGHVVFLDRPELKLVTFDSKSGPLRVRRDGELLTLDFPAKPPKPSEDTDALGDALGVFPVASFRALDFLAVFESEEEVASLEPDFQKLSNLELRGVIATAPGEEVDFVSRFFAPKYGIDEDPVTGSAHCTLAPYWGGLLGKSELIGRQISPRGGTVLCRVDGERVFLSGKVIQYLEGWIEVPVS